MSMRSQNVGSDERAVGRWLLSCCVVLLALIMLGGATRLTESGLSIVDWKPVTGIVPPWTDAEWADEFERYRESPQYRLVNRGMSLDDFRMIYGFEYAHRLLARLLGLVFALPLLWFWWRGRLPVATQGALAGILLLGALQGYMGWYMVKSGLVDMPRVSPFRLAAHLGLALIIYTWMFRLGIGLLWPRSTQISPHDAALRGFCKGLMLLLAVTIVYGAFVAGHRAGHGFNTFPLMNGKWVPDGLWALQPGWRNLLENNITLQFAHRCLAIGVLAWVWWGWVSMRFRLTDRSQRIAFDVLAGTSLLQVALGIATLLAVVPVSLGTLHQGGAVLLLSSLLLLSSRCRRLPRECVLQSEARPPAAGVQYAFTDRGVGEGR